MSACWSWIRNSSPPSGNSSACGRPPSPQPNSAPVPWLARHRVFIGCFAAVTTASRGIVLLVLLGLVTLAGAQEPRELVYKREATREASREASLQATVEKLGRFAHQWWILGRT